MKLLKYLLVSFGFIVLASCSSFKKVSSKKFIKKIEADSLKSGVYALADTSMRGRMTCDEGQKKALKYIVKKLMDYGLKPLCENPANNKQFYQQYKIEKHPEAKDFKNLSVYAENIVASIEGKNKNEFLVISAHYDHLGYTDSSVYCGADDNGTGTSALLEMARVFSIAAKKNQPERTIVFVFFSGEEIGLLGSDFFTKNPCMPLSAIVADLNIDMIGRTDTTHKNSPDYIYIIGADRISKELDSINKIANKNCCGLVLDETFNAPNDPNRLYYRSDHYNFAKNDVPVIFYFSGLHSDYHEITDTPDKIMYGLYYKRTRMIFNTAWELAYRKNRPKKDDKTKH